MFWGRFALRHAVAADVALAALLYAGPLPLGAGPERATAAGQPAKVNSVTAFGSAPSLGPDGSSPFNRPPVALARAGGAGAGGYWVAASDGGVHSFGSARFFGSLAGASPARPVVGIAALPSGAGYWLVADDGGVFAFGSAPFLGSIGGRPASRGSRAAALAEPDSDGVDPEAGEAADHRAVDADELEVGAQ
jgi:hypothetical protein